MPRAKPKGRATRFGVVAAMALGTGGFAGAVAAVEATTPAAAASCVAAGSTGLTAAQVVTTNLTGPQTIDATGCDVGIFVPPGTSGITITDVTVNNANDHGIFVQDANNITISSNTVTGNGVAPTAGIAENKAIELVGTSNSNVTGNTVTGNSADGGIGIADDGAIDPGAPNAGTANAAADDNVTNNTSSGNYGGCGIVYAAYNTSGVSGGTISGNTVQGSPGVFGPHGPVIGGIVVASDEAGGPVTGVTVDSNTITGAAIPGVVVHSNAPNSSVTNISVTNNTLSLDDWLSVDGPPTPAGIIVAASPIPAPVTPVLTDITMTGNTITKEFYGIWQSGAHVTTTAPNAISQLFPGGMDVFTTPIPGTGYWQVASDGGVFNFGTAGFYGSMGGQALNAPVVGLAQTLDQGGYWEVASDGGVFSFGDAVFHGSMGGKPLNKPIVGIAATPYIPANPPEQPDPAGKGYWEVASDGGIFSFGDAGFYGSMGGTPLVKPVVGIAAAPDGHGYWEVASDGGVFNFGTAGYYGSMGGKAITAPIVGIASTQDGKGYWEVGSDGAVYAFGDAGKFGSMGGKTLNKPIVGISATPSGQGYWLVASDGGVFNFGDAGYFGSMGGKPLNKPIVGTASVGVTAAA